MGLNRRKMERRHFLLLLTSLLGATGIYPRTGRASSMSDESTTRDLFDRWERVWHDGQYDLVPSCIAENYIRHDEKGDRTVARDAYTTEIAAMRKERPGIRVVVYDHSFSGD